MMNGEQVSREGEMVSWIEAVKTILELWEPTSISQRIWKRYMLEEANRFIKEEYDRKRSRSTTT